MRNGTQILYVKRVRCYQEPFVRYGSSKIPESIKCGFVSLAQPNPVPQAYSAKQILKWAHCVHMHSAKQLLNWAHCVHMHSAKQIRNWAHCVHMHSAQQILNWTHCVHMHSHRNWTINSQRTNRLQLSLCQSLMFWLNVRNAHSRTSEFIFARNNSRIRPEMS
jgi:disulfide oxidoreductase YuzD